MHTHHILVQVQPIPNYLTSFKTESIVWDINMQKALIIFKHIRYGFGNWFFSSSSPNRTKWIETSIKYFNTFIVFECFAYCMGTFSSYLVPMHLKNIDSLII